MTLQEALKSEKRIRNTELAMRDWFEPTKNSRQLWHSMAVLSDAWEIEPESAKPVVFECEWNIDEVIHPVFREVGMVGLLLPFVGKKTKVTIEVVE